MLTRRTDGSWSSLATEASSASEYGCRMRVKTSVVVAASAIRPAYITSTRSARSAMTPMSWVMRTTDMSRSRRSRSSRSRIWAWMVTSRAVVGSSAIRSFGVQTRPMAIITRWRKPPESSWA